MDARVVSGAANEGGAKIEPRLVKIALVGLICLFTLSVYTLGYAERELDIDELWTMEAIAHSPSGMILQIATDIVRPPLYFFLLKLWVAFAGVTPASARLFSLIFGLWAIFLIYRLGSELYAYREGLWAALLLTVSNFHLYYATEIRMYSMVTALGLLSTLWFFRECIHSTDKKRWYGYAAGTLLLTWTHILAWFLVGGQGLYLLLRAKEKRQRFPMKWLRVVSLLVALNLPWVFLLARFWPSSFREVVSESGFPGAHALLGAAYLIGAFNGMLPIQNTMRYGFLPWSIPLLAVLWQRRGFSFRSISRLVIDLLGVRLEKPTGYLLLALVIPVACLTLISWAIIPLFIPRYLIYCLPVYYLIVSHCAVLSSLKVRGQLLVLLPALLWSIASAASLRLFL